MATITDGINYTHKHMNSVIQEQTGFRTKKFEVRPLGDANYYWN
jgi:hypothetical protein